MMDFTFNSAFWVFNMVSNFAYTRYSDIHPEIREAQVSLENNFIQQVKETDQKAMELYNTDKDAAIAYLTEFSGTQGNLTLKTWQGLYAYLFTKYMDGNIKTRVEVPEGYIYHAPIVKQPGYGEQWYRMIVEKTGDHFKVPGTPGH
jgi:dipeptidase